MNVIIEIKEQFVQEDKIKKLRQFLYNNCIEYDYKESKFNLNQLIPVSCIIELLEGIDNKETTTTQARKVLKDLGFI